MRRSVAVIGGGINGLFASWALLQSGFQVALFERGKVLSQTSAASSKLLHGGIRYLEHGHIKLVREALEDRSWWLKYAPSYTRKTRFFVPIYSERSRTRLKLYVGVKLYEYISGRHAIGTSEWHSRSETLSLNPLLMKEGLKGSVSYFDVQMNDEALGMWVLKQAQVAGLYLNEDSPVTRVSTNGEVYFDDGRVNKYDYVVNATGPWATNLLSQSEIDCRHSLKLVRGSHLIINRKIENALVLQVKEDNRIVFLLPQADKTILGTTEVDHDTLDHIECTKSEMDYLVKIANIYMSDSLAKNDIFASYAGVRPIIRKHTDVDMNSSSASRESDIEVTGRLVTILGGKWTSAPRLGTKVAQVVQSIQ